MANYRRQYRRQVDLIVSRHMTPAVLSARLAAFARKTLAETIAAGKAPPTYRRYVDGNEGAPEESVRPDGAILYRFSVLSQAAVFVLSYLSARAPVDTGRLRRSFVLFVRERGRYGNMIRAESFDPQRMNVAADEVTISNKQPYSRKADVQRVGTRKLVFNRRENMYYDAAEAVRQRFRGVKVERVYRVSLPEPYILLTGRNARRSVEYPGLVLSLRRNL